MRKVLLIILVLTGCLCEEEETMIINPHIYSQAIDPASNFIPVLLSWGQSNEIGRAEFERYFHLSPYSFDPTGIKIYRKTDYTSADNGNWENLQVGGPQTREYDLPTFTTYGSYVTAAIKLRALVNNKTVYIIPTADGGTVVNTLGTFRTWNPATSNECFDVAMDYYYQVAIDKLQAANPGVPIKVFIVCTEGETDAGQSRTQTQFFNDVTDVINAMRTYEELASAPLIAAKINYMQTAAETTINAAWEQYRSSNSTLVRLIETSDLKRKTDLTVTEKGGVSPSTGTDDEHLSYLAQNTKGLRVAEAIRNYYGWSDVSIVPASTNTAFDPSTLGTVHVRLQGTSGKVTLQANRYDLSTSSGAIVNDGSVGTFKINNGTYQYKEDGGEAWINAGAVVSGAANVSFIQTTAAVGTTLFNHSFSVGFWLKPRDGNPTAYSMIFHDVQNTTSVNNSRTFAGITTDGKINAVYAQGGTAVQATTNTAIFTDGTQDGPKHVAITFTSGGLIRIYVDGVLQTLDAVNNGDISGRTMASYVNATNVFTIGANRTGASSYANHYYGKIREFIIQPVVWSAGDIANLMLN